MIMRYLSWPISILLIFMLLSCRQQREGDRRENQTEAPVQGLKIHRYEQALFGLDLLHLRDGLTGLMPEYGFFLGYESPDTASLMRMRTYLEDSLTSLLFRETQRLFPRMDSVEIALSEAMQRHSKHFPADSAPRVFTYISGLDYEAPVRLVDSVMIIALDMYLGKDSPVYRQLGLPEYRCQAFDPVNLVPDCMKQMAYRHLRGERHERTLLDWMVLQGKVLYYLDQVLPSTPDYVKITYSPEQYDWVRENEAKTWAFLIANKLLYTTDSRDITRFMAEAPFTKGLPKESPGRTGWWIGWQIVRKYMEKNRDVSMKALFDQADARQILNLSAYKPAR